MSVNGSFTRILAIGKLVDGLCSFALLCTMIDIYFADDSRQSLDNIVVSDYPVC